MKKFIEFSRAVTWRYAEKGGHRSTRETKQKRGLVAFQLGFNVLMTRYFPEVYKPTTYEKRG